MEPEEWLAKPEVSRVQPGTMRPRPSTAGFSRPGPGSSSARSVSFSDDTALGNALSVTLASTVAPSEVDVQTAATSKSLGMKAAQFQAKSCFGPSLSGLTGRSRPHSARSCPSSSSTSVPSRPGSTSTVKPSASTLVDGPPQSTQLKATWTAVLEKCGVWRRGSVEGDDKGIARVDMSPVPPDAARTAWSCMEIAKVLNQLPCGILRCTLLMLVEELFHSIYPQYQFANEPLEVALDENSSSQVREDFSNLIPYFAEVGACKARAQDAETKAKEAAFKQAEETAKRQSAEAAGANLDACLVDQQLKEKQLEAQFEDLTLQIQDLEKRNAVLKYEANAWRDQMFAAYDIQMDLEEVVKQETVSRKAAETKNVGLLRETELLRKKGVQPEQRKPAGDSEEKHELQKTIDRLQMDVTHAYNERDEARAETRRSLSRTLEWPASGPHMYQWMTTPDAPPRIASPKTGKERSTQRRKSRMTRKPSMGGKQKRDSTASRSSSPRLSILTK